MSSTVLYRVASVLFLLFALGHTVGFLKFTPPTSEGVAVWDSMNNVHFHVGGRNYSYGGFYVGFGLFNSVYLFFSAVLAWHLGTLAARNPAAIGIVGWALCLAMVGSLVLCWIYFNPIAVTFSALLVALLGWASWVAGAAAARAAG
jgi:hypothetical protein